MIRYSKISVSRIRIPQFFNMEIFDSSYNLIVTFVVLQTLLICRIVHFVTQVHLYIYKTYIFSTFIYMFIYELHTDIEIFLFLNSSYQLLKCYFWQVVTLTHKLTLLCNHCISMQHSVIHQHCIKPSFLPVSVRKLVKSPNVD